MAQPVRRVPRRPLSRLAPLCARYAGNSAFRSPNSPAYRAQRRRLDAEPRSPGTQNGPAPMVRARPGSGGSADAAERRGAGPDLALADRLTGAGGVPHHAVAGVDADVTGHEHEVAGDGLVARDAPG